MAMMSRGEDQCRHCVNGVRERPWTVGRVVGGSSEGDWDSGEGMIFFCDGLEE